MITKKAQKGRSKPPTRTSNRSDVTVRARKWLISQRSQSRDSPLIKRGECMICGRAEDRRHNPEMTCGLIEDLVRALVT
jgi:hypothetical protein